MSATSNYASVPKVGSGVTTTADTSYSAPTNTTVGIAFQDVAVGSRIDQIDNISLGTSVAGLLRLWYCEGNVGPAISSITSSGTTATCTTATAHNLITGDLITLRGAFPVQYNVNSVAVTVSSATVFTFTIVSTSNVAARDVGAYSSTHAAAVYHLLKDIPIVAITGSATAVAYQNSMNSQQNPDFLPLLLPAGWSLRTTVTTTQTHALKTTARGGSF